MLDLKKPAARNVLDRLVADADVLVHNFRPGVPDRLGIGYARLNEINKRLIYVSLTGYGESGPLSGNAGFDQVLQTMTGICAFQGGSVDRPQLVLGSIVDYYTSALLAFSVSSALFHRARTGEGQIVGLSLLRTALAMQAGRFVWTEGEGREAARDVRAGGLTGLHPTKDGFLYISAHSAHFWEALCRLVGLPELARDPNYDTMRKRAERADEILPRLRQALLAHTAEEWEGIFGQQVPCARVRPIEDMFEHPQVLAEGLVATMAHAAVGSYRGVGKPIQFGSSPGSRQFGAPTLGQHTAEILSRHGYSDADIDRMKEEGAVR